MAAPRSKAMMTVPTVTPTDLVLHDGLIPQWMTMTDGSLHLVDTAPGITIGKDHPSRSAGTTTTAMVMDAVHPLVLASRTSRPRAVPTRTPMMPGPLPLRATMMIPIWLRGPMGVPVLHLEVTTLRMIVHATGKRPISVFSVPIYEMCFCR